ncbi:FAD-binding protein [Actinomadura xylanilytica]|uniref:FAD-binding protein n=1 Tax=Actinomadura xylanilytica TaxID=887459 RepID=UPI00255B0005|nr:FAD-binding protein [Actinomadura xylanilytica]MDL4774506.1 FAD-binding protein [Actinomadura xylanilytica]
MLHDFGGIVRRTPGTVIRPSCAREVAEAVREAAASGTPLVARGCGHSTGGQSQTGGVSLDLRGLATVHAVQADRVVVDAGATWREVLDATLPHGRTPPVLTDYLDLTVGGTLSAGGIGGTSHVHGTQAANVLELDVVTRTGEAVTCSPGDRRDVFDAVRAAMGRNGVITRAALRLVPAPERVLSFTVPLAGAAGLLRAQRTVRADHVSGLAEPGGRCELRAVVHDGDRPPPGLPPDETGTGMEVEELSFLDFADRMRPDVQELIALGEWARPHPWATVLLPAARAVDVIDATLAEMGPDDIGLSGLVRIQALAPGPVPVPLLRAPAGPVLFGLLRAASPGCRPVEEMLASTGCSTTGPARPAASST